MRLIKSLFIILLILGIGFKSVAQNPPNWTAKQLIEPSELAKNLKSNKNLPIIFSVGPGALIPNSIDLGPAKDEENLKKLKEQLKKLPKNKRVVIYCGCCPFEHCPNIRPAIQLLNKMKFTNFRLLNLAKNIKVDWIDKGYPTVPS
jgi:thiosulfate/3-mercaptopyruvate sulfurtransferase